MYKKLATLTMMACAILSNCATNKNEVKEIDTELEVKGQVNDRKIGINKNGEAVVQEEVGADDELRRQEWINNRLEEELANDHFDLKRCREDIADSRLGGDGSPNEIPEIDQMKTIADVKEEFGLNDDGEYKVVRREFYLERLNSERKYEKSLRKMSKLVSEHRQSCERKMGQARLAHGLPAKRFVAVGLFDREGRWIEQRKAENSLDDAFEIAPMEKIPKDEGGY